MNTVPAASTFITITTVTGSNRTNSTGGVGAQSEGTFGKGAGFGDLEPMCEAIRVQIGNYVFADTDEDGIQDGCDEPIAGVPVALYRPDGTLRATTTTDASGQYFFSSATYPTETWVNPADSLRPEDEVVIVFGYDALNPTGSPFDPMTNILSVGQADYILTLPNQEGATGSSDRADSDATLDAATGLPWDGYPFLTNTLGEEQTNFSFDAGFIPQIVDVALVKTVASPGPFSLGDQVTFDVKVINQGTKPLRVVDLIDAAGSGLEFNAADNQGGTGYGHHSCRRDRYGGHYGLDGRHGCKGSEHCHSRHPRVPGRRYPERPDHLYTGIAGPD